jgi:hypothetical protein
MADELTSGAPSATFHCPWCSASLPSADLETCPSCKATLTSTSSGEAALPGVTAIDHEALLRPNREPRQQRSRILSWLSGEYVDEGVAPAQAEAIHPPDPAVRREILRLEIEAEIADKQAEADSILADAAVEGRPIPSLEPVEEIEGEATDEDGADQAEADDDVLATQADAVSTDEPEEETPAAS